eukprot:CAMPEP_0194751884 /NCGR_PEP_ID=MMETSP0323_2-20130528/5801_1 /TAXON_ID=2866 ORGANISM="Crypthecodinium cohnii, Strain Seligo" /NCGR_SAMPLE_ID=MMETSP0323_2 /ASSEMBLY_ACC=CAM_ASM_000346 /LENGTH=292 /DNA_ID=CAMNT_0039668549 /DNA_START=189 /DNA_END=1063 /DNA_ORIENTATION=+
MQNARRHEKLESLENKAMNCKSKNKGECQATSVGRSSKSTLKWLRYLSGSRDRDRGDPESGFDLHDRSCPLDSPPPRSQDFPCVSLLPLEDCGSSGSERGPCCDLQRMTSQQGPSDWSRLAQIRASSQTLGFLADRAQVPLTVMSFLKGPSNTPSRLSDARAFDCLRALSRSNSSKILFQSPIGSSHKGDFVRCRSIDYLLDRPPGRLEQFGRIEDYEAAKLLRIMLHHAGSQKGYPWVRVPQGGVTVKVDHPDRRFRRLGGPSASLPGSLDGYGIFNRSRQMLNGNVWIET